MTEPLQNPKDTNIMAALSYVFVLCFIPLLLGRDSKFVQAHAKQGLVLFVVEVVVMILASILTFIPILGWFANFVMYAFVIFMALAGFFKALQGKKWRMPLLGAYAEKLDI